MTETTIQTKTKFQEVLDFIWTLAIIVGVAILLRGSVIEAFRIPSASMVPTLQIGDHIFVWKLSYGLRLPFMQRTLAQYSSPARGDVVVFTRPDDPSTPENESETNIIKRVIGLPGETLEVRGTTVLINDKPLDEETSRWSEGGIPEGDFGPIKIPDGKVIVLGDNRDHSKDSRFWNDPFLPLENIKGRAFIVYWSWDSMGRIGKLIR